MDSSLGVSWDLSNLFKDLNDPDIINRLDTALTIIKSVDFDYKSKIDSLKNNIEQLRSSLEQVEIAGILIERIWIYSYAVVSADSTNDRNQAFFKNIQLKLDTLQKKIASIEQHLGSLLAEKGDYFLDSPELARFRGYLSRIVRYHPYRLPLSEEQLIIEKDNFGIHEWSMLQQRLLSRNYTVIVRGEEKTCSWSEIYSFFRDSDRQVRREAITRAFEGLTAEDHIFATCLRNIGSDYLNQLRRRGYSSPVMPSLISNNVSRDIINNLLVTAEKNIELYHRYLLLKARALECDTLRGDDLYAPIISVNYSDKITWEEAKKLVIDSFSDFDSELGNHARKLFEEKLIDASPRTGKICKGFCAPVYSLSKSFILMSFTGNIDDLFTLAHEVGHAVHFYLSSRNQSYYVYYAPLVLLETASEFGVMLVIDKLLRQTREKTVLRSLLFKFLDNVMLRVFGNCLNYRFEDSLYDAIKSNVYLSADTITQLYKKAMERYYRDTVDFLPEQEKTWMYKTQYFDPNRHYYNYPYAFGELLMMVLFSKYRTGGKTFVNDYKALLAAGSSNSTDNLLKPLGIDLKNPLLWQTGFDEITKILEELRSLVH
ncbi:MAG: M3 family oligoendopeptidase [Candidatus Odinarchaeota archaeon]